ncbi:DUF6188 family protein [Reyranella sp.]|uniref:DUF6188 family protein n=1 Tax=Reyranella sp. TaxID=1929291 RepID=UPI0025D6EF3B|nr:DUF6188 family protein [Reyranella sp.]
MSFFVNKELFSVSISAHELILNFDDAISINVSSRIGWLSVNGNHDTYEDFSKAAPVVLTLLHDIVISAKGDTDGTLALTFRSGVKLEFYDTEDRYESYVIKNGDQFIAV